MANPKPCPKCPFRRSVEPGALGGSPTTKFLGQAFGPFLLPCHQHCDFDDPAWKDVGNLLKTPQCAGAATFRTHVGADTYLPSGIMILPADKETVFASPAEFMAHHDRISVHEAERRLKGKSVHQMLMEQLADPANQYSPNK